MDVVENDGWEVYHVLYTSIMYLFSCIYLIHTIRINNLQSTISPFVKCYPSAHFPIITYLFFSYFSFSPVKWYNFLLVGSPHPPLPAQRTRSRCPHRRRTRLHLSQQLSASVCYWRHWPECSERHHFFHWIRTHSYRQVVWISALFVESSPLYT